MKTIIVIVLILVSTQVSANTTKVEIDCLAEAIYFEARSESTAGQIAVGSVVINRVKDNRWPNDVCSVVHQKWQFSYYWDGKPEIYRDETARLRAWQYAEMIFFGTVIDITDGSVYYHTTSILPDWDFNKIERVMTLDSHIFYVDKK